MTLSPEELEALAVKPTENLQAYDLYLRGKRYARRQTRQDLEFALQMFENAVAIDPSFALAYAASANACAMFYCNYSRDQVWVERAREASGKAVALRWDLPEVQVSQAWVLYAAELHDEAVRMVQEGHRAQARLRGRLLPAVPRAVRRGTLPGSCGRCGYRHRSERRGLQRLRADHEFAGRDGQGRGASQHAPSEDGGARKSLETGARRCAGAHPAGSDYAILGRPDDALRELNLAVTLRANEASILYNAACNYCGLENRRRDPGALREPGNGLRDAVWARRDPDLTYCTAIPNLTVFIRPRQPRRRSFGQRADIS